MRRSPNRQEERRDEDGHVLHLWQPFHFQTGMGYDYRRRAWYQRALTAVVRTFAACILWVYERLVLGFRIVGRENLSRCMEGGMVTVCNHIHPLDCTMVDLALYPRRVHYVTLESNFRIPVVRHLIRVLGGVPLPKNPVKLLELFRAMEAAAHDGAAVHIYPEGVLIPYSDALRPFQNGAFRFAVRGQMTVVPMVIEQAAPTGWRKWLKRRPCLTLHILPPQTVDRSLPSKNAAAALERDCQTAMQHRLTLCRQPKQTNQKGSRRLA